MTAALTLPGTIPGLLRRGSPVRHPLGARGADIPCVVIACHTNDRTCVVGYPWPLNHEQADSWPLADLALDLTDATGRTHAAWWSLVNGGPSITAWTAPPDAHARGMAGLLPLYESSRLLSDLDPTDPRLLPDGSRWVNAEALRRVVLHVAGVP